METREGARHTLRNGIDPDQLREMAEAIRAEPEAVERLRSGGRQP